MFDFVTVQPSFISEVVANQDSEKHYTLVDQYLSFEDALNTCKYFHNGLFYNFKWETDFLQSVASDMSNNDMKSAWVGITWDGQKLRWENTVGEQIAARDIDNFVINLEDVSDYNNSLVISDDAVFQAAEPNEFHQVLCAAVEESDIQIDPQYDPPKFEVLSAQP